MKYEKDRKIAGMDEFKVQKVARFLIPVAIIAILILVILLIDRGNKKKAEAQTAKSVVEIGLTNGSNVPEQAEANVDDTQTDVLADELTDVGDNQEYIHNFDAYGLQKNAVPEINELIAKYQRAKVTGDVNLLYEVFGRTDEEGKEAMEQKLSSEMDAYESYENTVVYTTAGVGEGEYLVYVASDLKFRGIDTPAPMLIWAYIVPAPDGHLYIKDPATLSETENALLDKISASEDVKLLDSDMRKRLAQAVVSDVNLAALYEVWSDAGVSEGAETVETESAQDDEIVIEQ